MSLKKQFAVFITGVLLAALAGSFLINFNSTRDLLQEQMHILAKNTAESTAHTLRENSPSERLPKTIQLLDNLFNKGQYLSITLTEPEKKIIYQKKINLDLIEVPSWFAQTFYLKASPIKKEITINGTHQYQITITAHPGYAYKFLWENFIKYLTLFITLTLLFITLGLLYLNQLISPLKKLVQQAQSIIQKQYITQDPLPKTKELKEVASSMNSMVLKIKHIFNREAEITERLQKIAYQDSVTGLGNRAYFEVVLDSMLADETNVLPGTLAILHLHDLHLLNNQHGFLVVNQLLRKLIEVLSERLNHLPQASLSRLNGSDFAILAPETKGQELLALLQTLPDTWDDIKRKRNVETTQHPISIGVAYYLPGETRSQVLTRTNEALQQTAPPDIPLHLLPAPKSALSVELAFRIEDALEAGRIVLLGQPVMDHQGKLHSLEVFSQLIDSQGTPIPARLFTPMLKKEGLEADFDRLVISRALDLLKRHSKLPPLTVNLTEAAITNVDFQHWLLQQVRNAEAQNRIKFEFREAFLHNHSSACLVLAEQLRKFGYQIGLDHFGHFLGNKQFLQLYKPAYVKLAPGFMDSVRKQETYAVPYLASLIEMIDNLDIEIIAAAIEDEMAKNRYFGLGVYLFQGHLIGTPAPLKNWANNKKEA